jgi:hypothetical protein
MSHAVLEQAHLSATLPVELNDGLALDRMAAKTFGEKLSEQYGSADPFPHIVLDDFLPKRLAQDILNNFPARALEGDEFYERGYSGLHKRQISPASCNEYIRNVFAFFNSAPVLQFLEGLTQIPGLIPDPYFAGGGFHEISRGGKLGMHADFRINKQSNLRRRMNLLIYLNQNWKGEYGGYLELWDKSMKRRVQSIAPVFNRCVVFNTESDSFHGHPEPLSTPENVTRKSIALYYYTASQGIYDELPAHSTMYVARPGDSADNRKEAFELRARNYLRDWLPPIFLRKVRQLRSRVRGSRISP